MESDPIKSLAIDREYGKLEWVTTNIFGSAYSIMQFVRMIGGLLIAAADVLLHRAWWAFCRQFYNLAVALKLDRSKERQPYCIGVIKATSTKAWGTAAPITADTIKSAIVAQLEQHGFERYDICKIDPGQWLSLRRVDPADSRERFQWHIRIFYNLEVRGHYEYTPEFAPVRHVLGIGMECRSSDFVRWLGPCLKTSEW
jgi:hypothetical protein